MGILKFVMHMGPALWTKFSAQISGFPRFCKVSLAQHCCLFFYLGDSPIRPLELVMHKGSGLGHSTKSREWETPAKNLQSSVAIPSSEIPLFSNLLEFVGSCWELLGVVGTCRDLSGLVGSLSRLVGSCRDLLGVCHDLSGVSFGKAHSVHVERAPECFIETCILFIFAHKSFLHTNKPATMMQKMALSLHT